MAQLIIPNSFKNYNFRPKPKLPHVYRLHAFNKKENCKYYKILAV